MPHSTPEGTLLSEPFKALPRQGFKEAMKKPVKDRSVRVLVAANIDTSVFLNSINN